MYRRGCRCLPCRSAWAAEAKRWRRTRRPDVDADEAQAHLIRLRGHGVGFRQVARLTGLSPRTVLNVRLGLQTKILASTAERILRCPSTLAGNVTVTAWWPKRHIGALLSEGFSVRQLSSAMHVRVPDVLQAERVRYRTAVHIEHWYRSVLDDEDSGRRCNELRNLEVYAHG